MASYFSEDVGKVGGGHSSTALFAPKTAVVLDFPKQ